MPSKKCVEPCPCFPFGGAVCAVGKCVPSAGGGQWRGGDAVGSRGTQMEGRRASQKFEINLIIWGNGIWFSVGLAGRRMEAVPVGFFKKEGRCIDEFQEIVLTMAGGIVLNVVINDQRGRQR